MKVIDLLNKIAKGEEVPKKIDYNKKVYEYDKEQSDFCHFSINYYEYFLDDINTIEQLNDEVEIMKEKEIEKLELGDISPNGEYLILVKDEKIQDKINELIDEINSIKKEK